MTTTLELMMKWREEEIKDAVTWARDVIGVKDPKRLDDFGAGFKHGWGRAVSALRLHGVLKDKPE